jgi:hypothetical protein
MSLESQALISSTIGMERIKPNRSRNTLPWLAARDDHRVVARRHEVDQHDARHRHGKIPRKRELFQPTCIQSAASSPGPAAANKKRPLPAA